MTMEPMLSRQGMTPTEQACHWVVRLDGDELTSGERAAFDAWRSEPVNAAAYRDVTRMQELIGPAVDDPHLRAMRRAALALRSRQCGRRRVWMMSGIAAALVFALAAFSLLPQTRTGGAWLAARVLALLHPLPQPMRYTTRVGERLEVSLPDGSDVALNTATVLEATYTASSRAIRLERGQAYFNVTKDPARPFVVATTAGAVTAIGTAFEVLVAADQLQVLVEEGKVTVTTTRQPSAAAERPAIAQPVAQGQRLLVRHGGESQLAEVDVARALRWRSGFVEFDDVTLAEAVHEMNRYTNHVVQLRDEHVTSLRISGVFRVGQTDRFLEVIGELLPIQVSRPLGAPIIVSLKPRFAREAAPSAKE
ncbi:MAG: FecR domain-containing protein [Gammaproteobacteria bacterium]|nr:FecR domain-containing protein [Gammaproteobacteria bacterium]